MLEEEDLYGVPWTYEGVAFYLMPKDAQGMVEGTAWYFGSAVDHYDEEDLLSIGFMRTGDDVVYYLLPDLAPGYAFMGDKSIVGGHTTKAASAIALAPSYIEALETGKPVRADIML